MPELPEVETTCRALRASLRGRRILRLDVRRALRWPIPEDLAQHVRGQTIVELRRRAKYLLLELASGAVLIHLGMSGSLRLVEGSAPRKPHDHVELELDDGRALRMNDPRCFGSWLWQPHGTTHPLLARLGPEPLDPALDPDYLWAPTRGRRAPIKTLLMDQHLLVGVGNIYAAEALFRAGIRPHRPAGRLSRGECRRLLEAVRAVLHYAIARGGTTLRDFLSPDGTPGHFEQELMVYGRTGAPCRVCTRTIRSLRLGQRASAYCPGCQR